MDLEKLKFDTENNLSGFYASGSLRRINDELSYYKIWHFDPVNKKFISIQVNPKGSVYEFLESFNWNEKTESIWRGSYKVVVNNENVWLITKGLYSPEQGNMDDYQEEVFLVQGKTLQQYKYGQKIMDSSGVCKIFS